MGAAVGVATQDSPSKRGGTPTEAAEKAPGAVDNQEWLDRMLAALDEGKVMLFPDEQWACAGPSACVGSLEPARAPHEHQHSNSRWRWKNASQAVGKWWVGRVEEGWEPCVDHAGPIPSMHSWGALSPAVACDAVEHRKPW